VGSGSYASTHWSYRPICNRWCNLLPYIGHNFWQSSVFISHIIFEKTEKSLVCARIRTLDLCIQKRGTEPLDHRAKFILSAMKILYFCENHWWFYDIGLFSLNHKYVFMKWLFLTKTQTDLNHSKNKLTVKFLRKTLYELSIFLISYNVLISTN